MGRNIRLQELLGGTPRIIMGGTDGFDDDTENQGAVVLVLSKAVEVTEALEASAHDDSADDPVLVAVASAVAATALAGAAVYCFVRRLALNLFSYHSLVYIFLVLFNTGLISTFIWNDFSYSLSLLAVILLLFGVWRIAFLTVYSDPGKLLGDLTR